MTLTSFAGASDWVDTVGVWPLTGIDEGLARMPAARREASRLLGSPPVDGMASFREGFKLGRLGIGGLANCAFCGTDESVGLEAEASILARLFEVSKEERSRFGCVLVGGALCIGCGVEMPAIGIWFEGTDNEDACCCSKFDNWDNAPGGIAGWPFIAISGCRTGKLGCADARRRDTWFRIICI